MGLSGLPAPSEGVLCVVQSILHIVGIASSSPSSDSVENPSESFEFSLTTCDGYMEEFRNRTPAMRFDAICSCKQPEYECSVCLTRFEPESEVNRLTCGHLFHKVCLEKWLDYQKVTCPDCRTPLLHEQEASCIW
ncbi:hypothetical protein ES319_A11G158200v1 [Gossypium barbadense]|uniref:RING-type domain-containing protein n=1 Tax=Gossypium barbadense TaxID=3634 RepID=A0A2P5S6J9_GOSBA|nr:hypothetical protein ES319_A11G158200v1 [Gossypium barbadense]PPD94662.1 hypothetical protein GOBAR_DD08313 [Gossypium barbadense]PPS17396.1 hypothetical protein GOBAR_AA03176 [Gossypium barbadense]